VKLIIKASLKDAFFIALFFLITVLAFSNLYLLKNYWQLSAFLAISLIFAFIDETISLKLGRWEYADKMPRFFGVGVSPFLELAVTGLIAFILTFYL